MAKPKEKLFSKRMMTIAGLFTAGSIVGASVDFDSLLELNYTLPSMQISNHDENISFGDTEISAAKQDTIQISETVQETYVPEIPVIESALRETEKESVSEPSMSEQQVVEEQPIISEPTMPEMEFDTWSEPESMPIPPEDWRNDDWMEAIFVPAEQPEELPSLPNDWLEKAEESVQTGLDLSNESSMTSELAGMLEGIAVFWTPSGGKIHLNPSCRSFEENTVRYAGTLEEAQMIRTEGWCKLCAEHLDGTDNSEFYIKGNIYSTKELLLDSYTYTDYYNGIPAN